jgi:putative phage-type endonuclease
MATTLPKDNRDEWLQQRRNYLGGTDVAAIVGENQFKSPLQVWLDKKGLSEDHDNPRMRYGREREPFIAERYAEMMECELVEVGTFIHPVHSFFAANPDRLILHKPAVLECKSGINRHRGTYGWGEPGTDQVPRIYLIQGVCYLGVCNLDFCDFAFEDRETCETNVYRVWRDMEYENLLFQAAEHWWNKYIIGDIEPPADERDLEMIARAHPTDNGLAVAATEEIEELVHVRMRERKIANEHYKLANDAEARIKQFMGEAATLELQHGHKITYRNNAASKVVDWQALCLHLGANEAQVSEFTTDKPGPRVIRFPKSLEVN